MKHVLALAAAMLLVGAGCSKQTDEQMLQDAIDMQKFDKVDEALGVYQNLLEAYPQSPKVPEALYAMANLYHNNKRDFHRAVDLHRRIVAEYPQHATASSSSFLIGFILNNEIKDTAAARVAYTEYLQKYPASPMVTSAQFELDNLGKDPSAILNQAAGIVSAEAKKSTMRKKP